MVATRPVSLRSGLRRLSVGLIAYGAIGLAIALVGLVGLLYVAGRVGDLADRATTQVESLIATIDSSATVLDDAGASARSFAVTLERTPPTVRQAAQTVGSMQVNLRDIAGQLAAVAILGSRPLAGTAARFGEMATNLEGLDTRLSLIASDLEQNRDKLLANAGSLTTLGERLDTIAAELRAGFVSDSLADLTVVPMVVIGLLVVWGLAPAVGALALGLWLRRTLGPT
ncbi:MAG: hypothetical protein ACXW4T_08335 [Candidatus Limnocylindrales bacterium]